MNLFKTNPIPCILPVVVAVKDGEDVEIEARSMDGQTDMGWLINQLRSNPVPHLSYCPTQLFIDSILLSLNLTLEIRS